MAKYLISFPRTAMVVADGDWEAVARDAHAVIDDAKAAGVHVFSGGIDEDVLRCSYQPRAPLQKEAILGRHHSMGASRYWNFPLVTKPWHGLLALPKPAVAIKNCASLDSIRNLEDD